MIGGATPSRGENCRYNEIYGGQKNRDYSPLLLVLFLASLSSLASPFSAKDFNSAAGWYYA